MTNSENNKQSKSKEPEVIDVEVVKNSTDEDVSLPALHQEQEQLPQVPPESRFASAYVPLSLDDAVESFWQGKSQDTIRSYAGDWKAFAECMRVSTPIQAFKLLLACHPARVWTIVEEFKSWMKDDKGWAPKTINRRLSSIRSLVKLAKAFGLCDFEVKNKNLKVKKVRDTTGVGRETLNQILEEASKRTDPIGIRNHAMLRLSIEHGFRRIEVQRLNLGSVDLQNQRVEVEGKGRDELEWVPLCDTTWDALLRWIDCRGKKAGPLFISFSPAAKGQLKRIGRSSINEIYKDLSEEICGVHLRTHAPRHDGATDLLKKTNGNIPLVMQWTRHKDPRTLMEYWDAVQNKTKDLASMLAESSTEEDHDKSEPEEQFRKQDMRLPAENKIEEETPPPIETEQDDTDHEPYY